MARDMPVFPGSEVTIGDYDGAPLNLTVHGHRHSPFRRALAYQALRACKQYVKLLRDPRKHGSDWCTQATERCREELALAIIHDAEDAGVDVEVEGGADETSADDA
jgi:hypothetical protein